MLINLRNALMSGKRLPYDAEVEYLQSTGTQWIDTGYVPTSTSGAQVVGEFISLPTSDYSGFFGCKTTGVSDRFWAVSSNQNNGTLVGFGNNYMMASASLSTIYTTQVNYKNSRTATFTSTTNVSGFNNGGTMPVFLFAVNIGAQAYYRGSMRIYSAQLTESSEIVRDFIPVRKGTVGYLYDRVSGKLFGNAGTGDFVVGPDVVPVEYLEGHGAEWIDTGIRNVSCNSSFSFRITASFPSGISGTSYIGSGMSSPSTYQMFYALNSSSATRLYMSCNGATNIAKQLSQDITSKHIASASVQGGNVVYEFDNVSVGSFAFVPFTLPYLYLFSIAGVSGTLSGMGNQRVFDLSFSADTKQIRAMTPVRVGTGSTWEGAMMDVLTRRIYRNAGTGAFTYGNDLKYPIPSE